MKEQYTKLIKKRAGELGFFHCGISKATFLEEEAPLLERWLTQNRQGQMSYMERNFEKRLDPRILVPGAKSVVSLLLNYYPAQQQQDFQSFKISKYAYGKDYHTVIKEKLFELDHFIQEEIGEVGGRVFVDSAPVMDKAWAKRSGLGWIGKNSNLLNKMNGSFFFIAEMILDLELEYDGPVQDYCGSCRRCMEACPTQAITDPYVVDGSKCISYFTIELKEAIPEEVKGKFDDWIFGCDICQDVCPWNRFAKAHSEPAFEHRQAMFDMSKKDWVELTEETFQKLFKDTPLQRPGFKGLKRNIDFVKSSKI